MYFNKIIYIIISLYISPVPLHFTCNFPYTLLSYPLFLYVYAQVTDRKHF